MTTTVETAAGKLTPNTDLVGERLVDNQRILLVEDDAISREVALLMLGQLHRSADVAASGIEALEAVRAHHYELILMDIQIPGGDGVQTTREIRSEFPERLQPFVVAMTASVTVEDQNLYAEAGMDDVLPKPVRMEQLAAALKSWTARRRTDRVAESADWTRSTTIVSTQPITRNEDPSVYDPGPLDSLIADLGAAGSQLRIELIETFLRDGEPTIAAIAAAGHDTTGIALAFISHELKSASARLGLQALSGTVSRIEAALRNAAVSTDVAIESAELIGQYLLASEALRRLLTEEGEASHPERGAS